MKRFLAPFHHAHRLHLWRYLRSLLPAVADDTKKRVTQNYPHLLTS